MSRLPSIQPVRGPGKLCEVVRGQLESMILNGSIKVNDQLPTENALSGMFGVSRTVVREAIHRLEAQGLVQARVGSGSYVLPFRIDEIKAAMMRYGSLNPEPSTFLHMLELRELIECENAARVAATATPETLRDLQQIIDGMHTIIQAIRTDPKQSDRLLQADMDFHMTIARATGNPFFATILEPLKHLVATHIAGIYRGTDRLDETYKEHAAIVAAIASKDQAKARSVMLHHIEQSRKRFLGFITPPTQAMKV
jgi:GntR family transcriptional repressor for pyruvate dehydrogenase complex